MRRLAHLPRERECCPGAEDRQSKSTPQTSSLPALRQKGLRAQTATKPCKRGRLDQYVVADRDALGFAVNDQRKNRKSHRSQRNGRIRIAARMLHSKIPFLRERWIRTLLQCGQLNIFDAPYDWVADQMHDHFPLGGRPPVCSLLNSVKHAPSFLGKLRLFLCEEWPNGGRFECSPTCPKGDSNSTFSPLGSR